ncbi:MAG: VPLPA-CTERM sorting domain-containing protein [Paracoccaceae bacterium]|nr:VPLPA-CTERM sorting domain-containing protein [Paracoccaceae bacterium]
MNYLSVATVAAIAFCESTASAATIDFDVNKDWTNGAHTYTNGVDSVSVEAFLYTKIDLPTLFGNPYLASWSGDAGLGICSGSLSSSEATGCALDDHQVDGADKNEVAVLNFGSLIVKLTSIVFSNVERDDRYDLFAFANGIGAAATESNLTKLLPNNCSICSVSDFFLAQGSIFGIGADSANSEFKIKSISFEVIPAQVPLPAAGWMLIAGLGGLAAVRNRAKAA